MSDDTEHLKVQVEQLTRRLEKTERERDSHLDALRVAGEKARQMRGDIDRISADVHKMAAVCAQVMNDTGVSDRIRQAAIDALTGEVTA